MKDIFFVCRCVDPFRSYAPPIDRGSAKFEFHPKFFRGRVKKIPKVGFNAWPHAKLVCKFRGDLLRDAPSLPSNRHHRSSGDCLEGKGENYQVCSVQYCATLGRSAMHTHMNRLTVLWIGFCLTGPISLCLDSFLYCVLLCVACLGL